MNDMNNMVNNIVNIAPPRWAAGLPIKQVFAEDELPDFQSQAKKLKVDIPTRRASFTGNHVDSNNRTISPNTLCALSPNTLASFGGDRGSWTMLSDRGGGMDSRSFDSSELMGFDCLPSFSGMMSTNGRAGDNSVVEAVDRQLFEGNSPIQMRAEAGKSQFTVEEVLQEGTPNVVAGTSRSGRTQKQKMDSDFI